MAMKKAPSMAPPDNRWNSGPAKRAGSKSQQHAGDEHQRAEEGDRHVPGDDALLQQPQAAEQVAGGDPFPALAAECCRSWRCWPSTAAPSSCASAVCKPVRRASSGVAPVQGVEVARPPTISSVASAKSQADAGHCDISAGRRRS